MNYFYYITEFSNSILKWKESGASLCKMKWDNIKAWIEPITLCIIQKKIFSENLNTILSNRTHTNNKLLQLNGQMCLKHRFHVSLTPVQAIENIWTLLFCSFGVINCTLVIVGSIPTRKSITWYIKTLTMLGAASIRLLQNNLPIRSSCSWDSAFRQTNSSAL